MTDAIATLAAKQAITEGLYRYCRGIDRMDRALMATVFHPDATVDYSHFAGTWQGFTDWVWKGHESFAIHSHQVTNILIEVEAAGDRAESESYVIASLWRPEGEPTSQVVVSGHGVEGSTRTGTVHHVRARYADRWSLRQDTWGIDYRRCIVDLQTIETTTGLLGGGRRDPEDPSYQLESISRLSS